MVSVPVTMSSPARPTPRLPTVAAPSRTPNRVPDKEKTYLSKLNLLNIHLWILVFHFKIDPKYCPFQ